MDEKTPNSNRKITLNKFILIAKLTHLFINLPDQSEDILQKLESDLFHFYGTKKRQNDKKSNCSIIQKRRSKHDPFKIVYKINESNMDEKTSFM